MDTFIKSVHFRKTKTNTTSLKQSTLVGYKQFLLAFVQINTCGKQGKTTSIKCLDRDDTCGQLKLEEAFCCNVREEAPFHWLSLGTGWLSL